MTTRGELCRRVVAVIVVTTSSLLNDRHREIIGAPEIGRVTLVRMQREF